MPRNRRLRINEALSEIRARPLTSRAKSIRDKTLLKLIPSAVSCIDYSIASCDLWIIPLFTFSSRFLELKAEVALTKKSIEGHSCRSSRPKAKGRPLDPRGHKILIGISFG